GVPRRREISDRGARGRPLRGQVSGEHDRRGPDDVSQGLGADPLLQHPAGAGASLRGPGAGCARGVSSRGYGVVGGAGSENLNSRKSVKIEKWMQSVKSEK